MSKKMAIGTVGALPALGTGIRGCQRWAPYAAIAWSLIYAALGLCWAVGERGFHVIHRFVARITGQL